MAKKQEEQQIEEKTISLDFTETEIREKIEKLSNSESVKLFIAVKEGEKEYNEMVGLIKVLEGL